MRRHPRFAMGLRTVPLASTAVVLISASTPAAVAAAPPFAPKVSASVDGHVRKGQHPQLRVTIRQRPGEAPLRAVVVLIPRELQPVVRVLIRTCPVERVELGSCPASARIGDASAISSAIDGRLSGPVILAEPRTPPEGQLGLGLPDLLVDLHGGGFSLPLVAEQRLGATGRLRTLFRRLPAVPVQQFTLRFYSRSDGPLKAALNLCRHRLQRFDVKLRSHDGRAVRRKPHLRVPCSNP